MKSSLILVVIILAGALFCRAQENIPEEIKSLASQSKTLFDEGKYTEYIDLLDQIAEKYPQFRKDILQGKIQALDKLERNREAVLVAIEIDLLEGATEVGKPCDIAWRYAISNDTLNALKWAKVSADRGFQNYNYYLANDEFKILQGQPAYNSLIEQIKGNAGLGIPAKKFVRKDISGNELSLEKYSGKVVLLDFWATWCAPCVAELPSLLKLYDEFKTQGFEIIGISLDKDKTLLEKFLLEKRIEWPIVFSGDGWNDVTKELYGVRMVPASWVIDKKGIIRYSQVKGDKLKNAIMELIKE
jgi:thiol-disulfide isomerase/thioredoxin